MALIDPSMESMAEAYVFETNSLLEKLDDILMRTEQSASLESEDINEIFRIMHTIKGSSAMMTLDNMSKLAHSIEDMFYILREDPTVKYDMSRLYNVVFKASDLLKAELGLVGEDVAPTDFSETMEMIRSYIKVLKGEIDSAQGDKKAGGQAQKEIDPDAVSVKVKFEDGCMMENIRALILINSIKDSCKYITFEPGDIETNGDTANQIIENGFVIHFVSMSTPEDIFKLIENAMNVESYEVLQKKEPTVVTEQVKTPAQADMAVKEAKKAANHANNVTQSLISVKTSKLDELMDMVGEIVITEAMVVSNPDLKGLKLDNFQKASRELKKLTDALQDIAMSMRMLPVSGVFNKMNRIVRDMKIKLNKDVDLVFEGEETEIDKTIFDQLNDPLMHMVRNAMDHGIETAEEYKVSGKTEKSKITLFACNTSSDVIIKVIDNGKGINKDAVLKKAIKNGILKKDASLYTDKEIYNLIMEPGFSTNETVSEFSGRGVGTDVVRKNIEKLGGTVSVESNYGYGTTFVIKIPLSLSIVDGMEVTVGKTLFTIPVISMVECFKYEEGQLHSDPDGNEMIILREECYPFIRLYDLYQIKSARENINDGLIIVVEAGKRRVCLYVDDLVGEQQVVVKPFSPLLNEFKMKEKGMSGCSILGDGSITVILDVNTIINEL